MQMREKGAPLSPSQQPTVCCILSHSVREIRIREESKAEGVDFTYSRRLDARLPDAQWEKACVPPTIKNHLYKNGPYCMMRTKWQVQDLYCYLLFVRASVGQKI